MFTLSEKIKIMAEVGHSPKLIDEASSDFNPRLNKKFDLSADMETEVRGLLEKIVALDEKEDGSMAHAGVKRVDDIEFFENGGATAQIKKQKTTLAKKIALILDIPFYGSGGSCIPVGIA